MMPEQPQDHQPPALAPAPDLSSDVLAGLAAALHEGPRRHSPNPYPPLLVHSSLRRIGLGAAGAPALFEALAAWAERGGTAGLMPSFSYSAEDPAAWIAPPLPAAEIPAAQAATQPYERELTPVSADIGFMPEYTRRQPGAVRSGHPTLSFCAIGPVAAEAVAGHPLDMPFGLASPLGWLCRHHGLVLMAGTGLDSLTLVHLAETLAPVSHVRASRRRARTTDGWRWFWGSPSCSEGFGVLRGLVDAATVAQGMVGRAEARLLDAVRLVETTLAQLTRDPGWLLCPAEQDCLPCGLARDYLNGRRTTVSYGGDADT